MSLKLTLGPNLFNWPAEKWRDFYFRIADEAPLDVVYIGENICSKRAPLFEPHLADVVERLERGSKQVIFSSLAEVTSNIDRKTIAQTCSVEDYLVEANDISALWHLDGRPCTIGPFVNVYNETALDMLARKGASSICLAPEMPIKPIGLMCKRAKTLDVEIETQVYGRIPLALSARCYHARAHNRTKDSCLFVCDEDADGMLVKTLDNTPFLAINGILTMSNGYLNLAPDIKELAALGVSRFRLSPHSGDMVKIASLFADVLAGKSDGSDMAEHLGRATPDATFINGFLHGENGHKWCEKPQIST